MKKIFVLMVMVSSVKAQNRTNVWMLGYNYTQTYPDLGFSFQGDSLSVFTLQRPMGFLFTDASICDTNGNLLFYTNGITVENQNHDTLNNSIHFNPGYSTDYYDNGIAGLGLSGGAIVVPRPNSSSQYYLFSESGEIFSMPFGYDVNPLELRYSLIDMTLDGGLGGIAAGQKKVVIINDTLSFGRIGACKHANGRDWWVIVHQYYNNRYYKLLITPDTIYGPYEQTIGFKTSYYDPIGKAFFSDDGSKYIMMETRDSIDFFDFDRCTGELSNEILLLVPDSEVTTGVALSENNRFLYVSTYLRIFQYDLWSGDIPNSIIEVAEFDTSQVPLYDWFSQMQLGLDSRIYIATWGGTNLMHFIENPDSLGNSCNVVQSGLALPSHNSNSVPNFPNYDLGALTGSPCDTLSIPLQTFQPQTPTFHFSPNPASSYINIVYSVEHNATLTITNAYGIAVKQLTLYPYFKNRIVYVDDLAEGIYLVTLREGDRVSEGKVVVQR